MEYREIFTLLFKNKIEENEIKNSKLFTFIPFY